MSVPDFWKTPNRASSPTADLILTQNSKPTIDELNVLQKINAVTFGENDLVFKKAMASTKWEERGAALNELMAVLIVEKDMHIKLSETDLDSLVSDLKTVFENEKNLFFIVKALKIVKALADGMQTRFSQHVPLSN